MMSSFNDTPHIMNVRDMIEFAFGYSKGNTVNFKLVQTVLFLLARQLRLLERRVKIELSPLTVTPSDTTLSVTEVKIHAGGTKAGVAEAKTAGGAGVNDRTHSGKTKSSDKASTDKTSSPKPTSSSKEKSSPRKSGAKKPDTHSVHLDPLEEQKEKVLRIIHQRADSFEQATKSPTPMASVSSMQAQHEKLLVVQRVPSSEARGEEGQKRTPQISVVTQEQYERLAQAVRQLEKKLQPVSTPGFPDHVELMEELRKGASPTDAMAALQLSARLEATEKCLAQMIAMVTELARQTPGVELDSETQAFFKASDVPLDIIAATTLREFGATNEGAFGTPSAPGSALGSSSRGDKASGGSHNAKRKTLRESQDHPATIEATFTTTETVKSTEVTPIPETPEATAIDECARNRDHITHEDLKAASIRLHDDLINTLTAMTKRACTNAEHAYKLSMNLDTKIGAALTVSTRMANVENLIREYTDQINAIDTGLSSQMTNYQEQLTQMQHDLEIGLDTMAEVLGNLGGDNEAVAELNSHFASFQVDFDNMSLRQKDLEDAQSSIAFDFENLWKEIEMLRDTKSDRDEVADALRDKAGTGELNGMVSLLQFDAVRDDFAKRIKAAYDKFNNQESVWQKVIDDLIKVLNEKTDLIQIQSLKNEINKHLNRIEDRMQTILDIVGEPKSALLSKKLFQDTACLSCGSPAHMDTEKPINVPALPKFHSARQPAEGAEVDSKSKGGGDHGICYPDFPIPHARDPRSHVCQRYCGGSHTLLREGPSRAPLGMIIQQAYKSVNTEPGTDGKMYLVDEQKIPCLACNMPKPTPAAPNPEPEKQAPTEIDESGNENISVTPPAHEVDFA